MRLLTRVSAMAGFGIFMAGLVLTSPFVMIAGILLFGIGVALHPEDDKWLGR